MALQNKLTLLAWSLMRVKDVCVAEHVSSSMRPIKVKYSCTLSNTPLSIVCNKSRRLMIVFCFMQFYKRNELWLKPRE
jgi:hypothetical protein